MSALPCKQHLNKKFDFDVDNPKKGLVFVGETYNANDIAFNERLEIAQAKEIGASAVYFRRFDDGRNSIAQIYIFDNTKNDLSDKDMANIHKKLWSGSIVPIYYVFSKTEVIIRSAREHINKTNESLPDPIETLNLVSAAQSEYKKYSANMFNGGAFWDERPANDNQFSYDKTAGNILIRGLKRARAELCEKLSTDENAVSHLLMVSIFIKYLEERKDNEGKKVLPEYFFRKYCKKGNRNDFCDAIRNGKIIYVLDELGDLFNGEIFKLNEETEKSISKISEIRHLANFLDAKMEDDQPAFWRLYDFNYIPVELISRIYEELMPQKKGVVYTPIHLANLIVDECMPIDDPNPGMKICDPSCGSGVFLVTAFRRLVQWQHLVQWREHEEESKKTGNETGNIEDFRPDVGELKDIIEKSIYGIDKEDMAIKLTMFSLSIAMCDMLSPTEIWTDLKFNNLREKNLTSKDFFEYAKEHAKNKEECYDLIIGNPPFGNANDIGLTNERMFSKPVPGKESALFFLRGSMHLLKPGGTLAFIMPPVPLLYHENKEHKFKEDFFSKYQVPQIIDFSLISSNGYLFELSQPAVAFFAKNITPSSDDCIQHIVVNLTASAKEKILFEIDKYDCHAVPLYIAINDNFVWKSNIMGGGGIYDLVKQYKKRSQTFKDFLDNKNLVYGEGYAVGSKNRNPAKWITDRQTVTSLKGNKIKHGVEKEFFFHSSAKTRKKIFDSPHLLIKKNINGGFHMAQDNKSLCFKHGIMGIHAHNKTHLNNIENIFNQHSDLYQFLILVISNQAGIARSPNIINTADIMNLPFPADGSALPKIMDDEQIIIEDLLEYGVDRLKKHEKAPVNIKHANDDNLRRYSEVFCRYLNRMYAQNGKEFHPDWVKSKNHTGVAFKYCKDNTPVLSKEQKSQLENGEFDSLMGNQSSESLRYKRIIKFHGTNVVYFIKPKTLRYWLRSIALRDAAEVAGDLITSGY